MEWFKGTGFGTKKFWVRIKVQAVTLSPLFPLVSVRWTQCLALWMRRKTEVPCATGVHPSQQKKKHPGKKSVETPATLGD